MAANKQASHIVTRKKRPALSKKEMNRCSSSHADSQSTLSRLRHESLTNSDRTSVGSKHVLIDLISSNLKVPKARNQNNFETLSSAQSIRQLYKRPVQSSREASQKKGTLGCRRDSESGKRSSTPH